MVGRKTNRSKLQSVPGGRFGNATLKKVSNGAENIDVEHSDFNSDIFEMNYGTIEKSEGDARKVGGDEMSEFVSKSELDALKELISSNRDHDHRINEERHLRVNDKIDHGNQLLSQKIDASNSLLVSQLESVSKDIEHMTSTLSLKFESELESRFSKEREASAADAKETRKWLWALAIPSVIGIVQIIVAFVT